MRYLLAWTLFGGVAWGQGFSPAEAVRRMTVAHGFQVELVAAEPDIRQPVAIDFDDRGRLWVLQYLQYPTPAGLKAVKVDRYLRTTYDKLPDPPPKGPKGADKLTIVEFVDGKLGGKVRTKDFVTGLNLATGFCFGRGGVFVLQSPYLLFYPDKDRDDVPDGDPKVLLTGFGMEDAHAYANSLQFGPDGWLYGVQGSTVTANIRGVKFQQGIWRYHVETDRFELFSEGGGNTWGLDFDATGQAITGTNYGGVACLHQRQGAYYIKGFEKHGALQNPHAYGYFDHVPYTGFQGGHVTCGGIVYQSDLLPPEFRNNYIAANVLSHTIDWHILEKVGSTFKAKRGGNLLTANDDWFRPIDICVGPDGSLFVADWYDKRANHVDPKDDWDRSNGRVYRISPKGKEYVGPANDMGTLGRTELRAKITHPSQWIRKAALQRLFECAAGPPSQPLNSRSIRDEGKSLTTPLDLLFADLADPNTTSYALNARFRHAFKNPITQKLDVSILAGEFEFDRFPNPAAREWAVRVIGDRPTVDEKAVDRFASLSRLEIDHGVQAQLACTAKRLSSAAAWRVMTPLVARERRWIDPQLQLLCWWAVKAHCLADPAGAKKFALATAQSPIGREIAGKLIRRYAAEHPELAATLLRDLPTPVAHEALSSLSLGLVGVAPGKKHMALRNVVYRMWKSDPAQLTALLVAAQLGESEAIAAGWERVPTDPKGAAAIVKTLAKSAPTEQLLTLALSAVPTDARVAALDALAGRDAPELPAKLLAEWPTLPPSLKGRVVDTLAGRKPWAAELLAAVDAGKLPPGALTVDTLRRIALLGDKPLTAAVERRYGKIGPQTEGEKLARVHGIAVSLKLAKGRPEAGKPLFKKHCGNCHTLFGEGAKVGPELTGADRRDATFLLTSIVDPSAVVRKEFMAYLVQTTDGRTLQGLVAEETPTAVTILDAKNQRVTLPRSEIEAMRPSPTSLMPEKLLDALDAQEVRDLMSYLQSNLATK